MAITDIARFGAERTVARAQLLCEAAAPGAVLLQLRDRKLGVRERLRVGAELVAIVRGTGQRLLVNDRLDLALALEADGVHLGEGSVMASDARKLLPVGAFVSRACHSLEQLEPRELGPVDAVVLSPVFAPKKGQPALGEEVLAEAQSRLARFTPAPQLFLLGGVDARVARRFAQSDIALAAIGAVFEGEVGGLVAALGVGR